MSRCPRASTHTSERRTTSGLPRMTVPSADSNSLSFDNPTAAAGIVLILSTGLKIRLEGSPGRAWGISPDVAAGVHPRVRVQLVNSHMRTRQPRQNTEH